jgi:hypothetical protein
MEQQQLDLSVRGDVVETFGSSLWGGAGGTSTVDSGLVPVRPLFYMALRLSHVTKAAQGGASPDQLSDALLQAQLMIDQAQIRRPLIYSIRFTQYVLGASKIYTLGPGGTLVSTSGTSIRPVRIEAARLMLSTTGTPIHLKIHDGTYDEFANLTVQDIPGALPKFLYCDYANPVANIYLIPQDRGGDTLELYDWQSFPNLQTVNDLISLPPGYQDWFVNKLAIRLASIFEERGASVSDDVRAEAQRAEAAIASLNTKSPRAISDAPQSGYRHRGTFNYYDGGR